MSGERQISHHGQVEQPRKHLKVTYSDSPVTLDRKDHQVSVDSSGGQVALYLPPVSQTEGEIYTIYLTDDDNGALIYPYKDSNGNYDDASFNSTHGPGGGEVYKELSSSGYIGACFRSDGQRWWVLGVH